jgi:cytochrome c-type protein NapC
VNPSGAAPARPQRNWRLILGFGLLSVLVGVLLVIGGAAGLAWTSTEAFCIGCHEMRDNVYAEYKDTIHDRNRTGVRAVCTDCHVPREVGPLLVRKMAASFEVWGHLTGVIDTREKFEAHRSQLAHKVWKRMLETDSHECRNCHKSDHMDRDKQSEKAQARHAKAKAEGTTCIECHFGIAHKEPEGPGPKEMKAVASKQ